MSCSRGQVMSCIAFLSRKSEHQLHVYWSLSLAFLLIAVSDLGSPVLQGKCSLATLSQALRRLMQKASLGRLKRPHACAKDRRSTRYTTLKACWWHWLGTMPRVLLGLEYRTVFCSKAASSFVKLDILKSAKMVHLKSLYPNATGLSCPMAQ